MLRFPFPSVPYAMETGRDGPSEWNSKRKRKWEERVGLAPAAPALVVFYFHFVLFFLSLSRLPVSLVCLCLVVKRHLPTGHTVSDFE